MRIFILIDKPTDDYGTLPAGERVFVFDRISSQPCETDFNSAMARMKFMFDNADPVCDRIVYNGPSWLIALAGMIWLTGDRKTMAMLAYDNIAKQYKEHNYEF